MNRERYDEIFHTYWPMQHPDELWSVVELLQKENAKSFIELGLMHGGTSFVMSDFMDLVIGIDISLDMIKKPTLPNMYFIKGSTFEDSTITVVKGILAEKGIEKVDALFVDADHDYSSIDLDYTRWKGFVKTGGILIFHDLKDSMPRRHFDSIPSNNKIIFSVEKGMGIGVAYNE